MILTGGAAKGAFEVGVLEYISEFHKISWISGTSVGAINAAGIASGATIDEMKEKWMSIHREDVMPRRPSFLSRGNQERLRNIIKPYVKKERIEQCKLPVSINARNLRTRMDRLFLKGNLMEITLASSAIQPYFPPVWIEKDPYADGMIISDHIGKRCDKVIVVDLMHGRPYTCHPFTFWIDRWLKKETEKRIESLKQKSDVVVIKLEKDSPSYDFSHTKELITKGYKSASQKI